MEQPSDFLALVNSNNYDGLHAYFQRKIPDQDELAAALYSDVKPNVKTLLEQYKFLLDYDLNKIFKWYVDRQITNLMVIAARQYNLVYDMQVLKTPFIINDQDVAGKTALHYALGNPENLDLIIKMIVSIGGLDIKDKSGISPMNIIQNLSKEYPRLAVRDKYEILYERINTGLFELKDYIDLLGPVYSYFDLLPADIQLLILPTLSLDEIMGLCFSSDFFNKRYCQDPSNPMWEKIYRIHLNDINIVGSGYMEQLINLYKLHQLLIDSGQNVDYKDINKYTIRTLLDNVIEAGKYDEAVIIINLVESINPQQYIRIANETQNWDLRNAFARAGYQVLNY